MLTHVCIYVHGFDGQMYVLFGQLEYLKNLFDFFSAVGDQIFIDHDYVLILTTYKFK